MDADRKSTAAFSDRKSTGAYSERKSTEVDIHITRKSTEVDIHIPVDIHIASTTEKQVTEIQIQEQESAATTPQPDAQPQAINVCELLTSYRFVMNVIHTLLQNSFYAVIFQQMVPFLCTEPYNVSLGEASLFMSFGTISILMFAIALYIINYTDLFKSHQINNDNNNDNESNAQQNQIEVKESCSIKIENAESTKKKVELHNIKLILIGYILYAICFFF